MLYLSSRVPLGLSPSYSLLERPSRISLVSISRVWLATNILRRRLSKPCVNTAWEVVDRQDFMELLVCLFPSYAPTLYSPEADVHMELERDIAQFLGTDSAILYSQAFSTISSVIPAFCKRGDVIVADRGVNFAIQKGLQISRSTIRWYDHNDLQSLEEVLQVVDKERRKKRLPLTRRFIVTEGIFEKDGVLLDLPKVVCSFVHVFQMILTGRCRSN